MGGAGFRILQHTKLTTVPKDCMLLRSQVLLEGISYHEVGEAAAHWVLTSVTFLRVK